MAGRRKRPPPQMAGREALENIRDTSETLGNPSSAREAKRQRRERYEPVDPLFRGPNPPEPGFDLAALVPGLKFVAKYVLPVLTLLLSIVWYASKLDSSVDSLKVEVKGIGVRTEELMKSSIEQSGRLDNLEMRITRNDVSPGASQLPKKMAQ